MTAKQLLEVTLRVLHAVRDLPLHEQAAVLTLTGTVLQAEAKSLELAQLEQQRLAATPPPADEHYRAQ